MCMTDFRAELVQLIVILTRRNTGRSDSELEVQRYGMKKNTLTVDPVMLEDEFWMRQHEKPFPNHWNRTAETEFSVFEFWGQFGSVLENIRHFHRILHTPTHIKYRITGSFYLLVSFISVMFLVVGHYQVQEVVHRLRGVRRHWVHSRLVASRNTCTVILPATSVLQALLYHRQSRRLRQSKRHVSLCHVTKD